VAATGLLLAGPAGPAAPALADTAGHFLQVAWSQAEGWRPAETDWIGAGQAVQVVLNPDGGLPNVPGATEQVHIAVRSTAADPAQLYLTLIDPDPEGRREASPGHFAELFDQLHVTIAEQGVTRVSAQAPAIAGLALGALNPAAAGVRVFDVTIALADSIDNRWLEARTGFTLVLTAVGQGGPSKVPPATTPPPSGPKVPTGGHLLDRFDLFDHLAPLRPAAALSLLAAGLVLAGVILTATRRRRRRTSRATTRP
jgi:hypothetical protein